jgi:hypothetical protein
MGLAAQSFDGAGANKALEVASAQFVVHHAAGIDEGIVMSAAAFTQRLSVEINQVGYRIHRPAPAWLT